MKFHSKLMFLLLISYLRVSSCEEEEGQERDQIAEMFENMDFTNARLLTDEDFLSAADNEEEDDFDIEDLPSVSDAIEFMMNIYEKGENLKKKMEEVTVKMSDTKARLAFQDVFEKRGDELQELINELIIANKVDMNKKSLLSTLDQLRNKKKDIIEKYAPTLSDLTTQQPQPEVIKANFKEYRDMLDAHARYSDMHDLYARYARGLKHAIGLSDTGLVEMTSKGLKWDPKSLQALLKMYQKLEGLKNQALLEKDEDIKIQMNLDILKVEKEMSKYVKENQEDLNNYSVPILVGRGVVDRTYSKMVDTVKKLAPLDERFMKNHENQLKMIEKIDSLVDAGNSRARNEL